MIVKCPECARERYCPEDTTIAYCGACMGEMEIVKEGDEGGNKRG